MTIPIDSIVRVNLIITGQFPARPGFGTLNILTTESGVILPAERIRAYGSIDEVADDWPENSEVLVAATSYFSQSPRPQKLKVSVFDIADLGDTDVVAALNDIEDIDPDWYCLITTNELRNALDAEAIAEWIEARDKVYFVTSNDADILNNAITTDIASVLQARSFRRTMVIYSSHPEQYPDASAFGRAATVNFDLPNSTITLMFKQLPGITVEALRTSEKTVLDSKNANAYIDVGGNPMFATSTMADGVFFDVVHGTDWLKASIQNYIFGHLYTKPTKVPYTDPGATELDQQAIRALDQARANGLIAPGTTTEGVYLSRGYTTDTVSVSQISPAIKQIRYYPGLSAVALGAGAIHGAEINITFYQ